MKKILFTLIAVLTFSQASAMSYEQARREALFLTDKMAYELNLSDAQYEAAYEINLDYLMDVTGRDDVFGSYWDRRNADLNFILYAWQWEMFCAASYFYRPLYWDAGYWHFGVYLRYPHRDYFYFGRPHFYVSYRGGHSWRMNGGRSYYEHHHIHYRPHVQRGHHFGMRDGWNRGDYRSTNRGNSSTRVTGDGNDRNRRGNGSSNGFTLGNSRSSKQDASQGTDRRNNPGVAPSSSGRSGSGTSERGQRGNRFGSTGTTSIGNSQTHRSISATQLSRSAGASASRSMSRSYETRPMSSSSPYSRSMNRGSSSVSRGSSAVRSSGSFSGGRTGVSHAGSHSGTSHSGGSHGGGRSGGRR